MDKDILPRQDRLDWFKHVGVIQRGKKQIVEFHHSLTEIRDRRLWRMKYESWDQFCRFEMAYGERHANRVIAGAKLLIALPAPEKAENGPRGPKRPSKGSKTKIPTSPDTERQARELARLGDDSETQSEAFSEAVDAAGGGQPSAAQIREAVNVRLADVPVDGEGVAVLNLKLRDVFLVRAKLKAAATHLTSATKLLKEVMGSDGAKKVVQVETLTKIGYARTRITETMPHWVCPDCDGMVPEECERCTGRGWLMKEEG